MFNPRRERGGTLVLIAICTLFVAIIGVAFFFVLTIIGGGRELQNANDSGNLNLAKQVLLRPAVSSGGVGGLREDNATEAQFIGVADSQLGNGVNLNSVNRVYAQAMLVAANAAAMQAEGSDTPDTVPHAQAVEDGADSISNRLAEALTEQNNVTSFFANLANANSIRMLLGQAQNGSDISHQRHDVSYCERGGPANVRVVDSQIPAAATARWNSNKSNWLVRLQNNAGDRQYMKGYQDGIRFLDRDIHFVPLKDATNADSAEGLLAFQTRQPNLITQREFGKNKDKTVSPAFAWTQPVPNAFLSRGDAKEHRSASFMKLASSAVCRSMEPRDGYYAAIPRGFIRIANKPCASGVFANEPTGQDAFVFLMFNPQVYGKPTDSGNLPAYFQKEGDGYLERISQANNSGQQPSAADCGALTPPANMSDCARIKNISSPAITNNNYQQFPGQFSAIVAAYNLTIPGGSGAYAQRCEHAVEMANLDLLSQRTVPEDPARIRDYSSGVGRWPSRTALSGGNQRFVQAASLETLLADAPMVRNRIKQRCYQILPTFDGNMNSIQGWSNVPIPMGQIAYIFFDGTTRRDGIISGNLRLMLANDAYNAAPWLQAIERPGLLQPDGKPAAFDRVVMRLPGVAGPSNVGPVNFQGDWSYPQPYDFYNGNPLCNKDTFLFIPSTGFRGLLGVLDMGACFGNTGCQSSHGDSAPGNPIVVPNYRDCSCDGCSFSGPC